MKTWNALTLEWEGEEIPPSAAGPGARLHTILASLGIHPCPGCLALAAQMDAWGAEHCRHRLPEIIAAMVAEVERREWLRVVPFRELGAEALVRLAIGSR